MPAIARVGDLCSGHGCYPPMPCIEGSSNVFLNGKAVTRAGDHWEAHCDMCTATLFCHERVGAAGQSNFLVNGKQVMRVGDPISCGSAVAQGSSDGLGSV